MTLLPHRNFDRNGKLDWRATIDASLAARPLIGRRIPGWLEPLAVRLPVGRCPHCSSPWGVVGAHSTPVDADLRVYVLCEACWRELPAKVRLVYYRAQYEVWLKDTARYPYGPKRDAAVTSLAVMWPKMAQAVRNGL